WSQNLRISHRAAAFNTTLSPAFQRGGTSLVLEAPATCRRTAPAFRRQAAGPPRSAICLAVRPLALQVAAILAEAPRWYESGLGPKSVSSQIPQLCRTARVWIPAPGFRLR